MQLHAWSDYCSILQPCYAVDHLHLLFGRQGTHDAIWIHNMCAQSCRGGRGCVCMYVRTYVCTENYGQSRYTSTHIQLWNVHRTRDWGILPLCCNIICRPNSTIPFSFRLMLISKLSTVKSNWSMACETNCWCIVAARRGWNLVMITSFPYINIITIDNIQNCTRMVPEEC